MASAAQIELLDNLIEKKQFPPTVDTNAIRSQFKDLSTKNASEWIEKALALPNREEGDAPPRVAPPF